MKTPDISQLRHRITFQNLTRVADGQGGFVETWSNFYECWAKINPKSGNERLSAQRIEDFYDNEITIRWPEVTLLTEMQIVFGAKIYQIKSKIEPDARRFFSIIKCEEQAGS